MLVWFNKNIMHKGMQREAKGEFIPAEFPQLEQGRSGIHSLIYPD